MRTAILSLLVLLSSASALWLGITVNTLRGQLVTCERHLSESELRQDAQLIAIEVLAQDKYKLAAAMAKAVRRQAKQSGGSDVRVSQ